MKRPWLLTQVGQRLSMLLATLITIALVPLAYQQINQETSRAPLPLDTASVDYCDVSSCGKIAKLADLEVVGIESVEETEFGTRVQIRLVNHGQLDGDREVWAELRSESGGRVESTWAILKLDPKGVQLLELFFTGAKSEFEASQLLLGF